MTPSERAEEEKQTGNALPEFPEAELQRLGQAMDAMDSIGCQEIIHRLFLFGRGESRLSDPELRQGCRWVLTNGIQRLQDPLPAREEGSPAPRREEPFHSPEEVEAFLCDTLRGINRLRVTEQMPRKNDLVEDAKIFIREHATEKISLRMIADHFYVNPSYFSTLFRTRTGKKYMDYVISVRMEKAKNLLETTDMSLTDVAEAVGYTDLYYFTTLYRREMGCHPREHRRASQDIYK